MNRAAIFKMKKILILLFIIPPAVFAQQYPVLSGVYKWSGPISIKVFCNGEINCTLKGVHAKTSVIWKYKAPEVPGMIATYYTTTKGLVTALKK
jgi:hypothetical protein